MEKKEIKAKYIFDEDFEPEYITGAFGGFLPGGDLSVNFYLERTPIPYETTQTLSEDGKLFNEMKITNPDPSEFKMRRTIKSGIIMSPSTALNVYKWLKEKMVEMGIDEYEL